MRKIENENITWEKKNLICLHVITEKTVLVVAREIEPTLPIIPNISNSAKQKWKLMDE